MSAPPGGRRSAADPRSGPDRGSGPDWTPGRRLLVLGVGSTLRRDDALGPAVAEALAAASLPEGVAARSVHGLVPELAVDLEEVDAVWFVDAAADPSLADATWARVAPSAGPGVGGGHALDPAALLVWTEAWTGRAPEAWSLALPAGDFGLGEGWSERGARSLREALDELRRRLGVDRQT
ncbi:MAG: hydrogenase maturation protease [Trueperaceae bacterium]|nr:hydrogenase maturation protease [Trueperaceae bacterium]